MIGTELSNCKEGWLHDFILLRQLPNGVEEGCRKCRTKRYYKIEKGKINNLLYIKEHCRQALPKFHNLFYREYPNKK